MALCVQGTMCVSVWAEGEPLTAKADACVPVPTPTAIVLVIPITPDDQ